MPSLITHNILGTKALKSIDPYLRNIIVNDLTAFSINTNGPDIFFYYGSLPWRLAKDQVKIINMGCRMHSHDINHLFEQLLSGTKDSSNSAKASVCGILCHWAMDSICHPYIFYRTNGHKMSHYMHREFESELDNFVIKQIAHSDIEHIRGYELIKPTKSAIEGTYLAYLKPLKELGYNDAKVHAIISKSLNDLYETQRVLYCKKNKKKVFHNIEKITHIPPIVSSMMIPNEDVDKLDVMNNNKKEWKHPVTGESFHYSFNELFDFSLRKANKVLSLYSAYLQDKIELEEVLKFINNESFETGLSSYQDMEYSDCIYK